MDAKESDEIIARNGGAEKNLCECGVPDRERGWVGLILAAHVRLGPLASFRRNPRLLRWRGEQGHVRGNSSLSHSLVGGF
jgi:hypothetical protein